jgi:hypothetical protein
LSDAEELVHLLEGDGFGFGDEEPDKDTHGEAAAGEEDVRSGRTLGIVRQGMELMHSPVSI